MPEGRLQRTRDNYPEGTGFYCSPFRPNGKGGLMLRFHRTPAMADAAEMLWVVLANVSGGDWEKQTPEWQQYAARWRDYYFSALDAEKHTCPKCLTSRLLGPPGQWCSTCVGQALTQSDATVTMTRDELVEQLEEIAQKNGITALEMAEAIRLNGGRSQLDNVTAFYVLAAILPVDDPLSVEPR